MDGDPFSDILRLTHADAILSGGFTAGGPWAIQFNARHKIKLSAIVRGSCWLKLEGEPPVRLEAGDVGLLVAQRAYVMASDLSVPPVDAMSLFSGRGRSTAVIGDGADFGFLGGHVHLDDANGQLLSDVLPPWMLIKAGLPEAVAFQWLLSQIVEEGANRQPGSQLAASHLAQLLFTQVLRAHLKTSEPLPPGWLKTLADPKTAPALRLMHGDPARAWGLEELAKACAMSRTAFAGHFKAVSGQPPLSYLTHWRMRLAERALREDDTAIAEIGLSLGYASESAFSTAFKRINGAAPRTYRSQSRQAAATAQ